MIKTSSPFNVPKAPEVLYRNGLYSIMFHNDVDVEEKPKFVAKGGKK